MIIKIAGEDAWRVTSDSNPDEMYKVTLHSCECKAFQFRGGYCKHIARVMTMLSNNLTKVLLESEDKELLVELLEESIKIVRKSKLNSELRYQVSENPEMEFDP
jgi:hypothetical protein